LGLETHVQHAISLVKNQVLDVDEGDTATLNQVDQTTGSSDQEIAATLNLAQLGANVGTTVHDTRADPGAVGELAGLVEDLGDQLTSGSENEGGGVSLALAAVELTTAGLLRSSRGAGLESLRENGEEETTGLSGTGLSAGHQVAATHDNGDRVLLDGSRGNVAGKLDVGDKVVVKRGVSEGVNGLGDVLAGRLNGDIVVVGEVDAGVLLGGVILTETEELTLQTGVGRAGDVLAVTPLTIARATGGSTAAAAVATTTTTVRAALSWMSVSIGIEGPEFSIWVPAGITVGRAAARAEVRGVGVSPVTTTSIPREPVRG
jgi:hypothetical protein